jgi:hypothetical protein
MPGKLAVSVTALFLLLSVVPTEPLEGFRIFVLWFSVLLMIISLFIYGQRLFIGRSVDRTV